MTNATAQAPRGCLSILSRGASAVSEVLLQWRGPRVGLVPLASQGDKGPHLPFLFLQLPDGTQTVPFQHTLTAVSKPQLCNLESCSASTSKELSTEHHQDWCNHWPQGLWGRRQTGGNTAPSCVPVPSSALALISAACCGGNKHYQKQGERQL